MTNRYLDKNISYSMSTSINTEEKESKFVVLEKDALKMQCVLSTTESCCGRQCMAWTPAINSFWIKPDERDGEFVIQTNRSLGDYAHLGRWLKREEIGYCANTQK